MPKHNIIGSDVGAVLAPGHGSLSAIRSRRRGGPPMVLLALILAAVAAAVAAFILIHR